ncbi:MAG: MAPEG family protein [Rickettsiales bacterium]|nr:MAPEG family protein [Rickettsiales bacterium]
MTVPVYAAVFAIIYVLMTFIVIQGRFKNKAPLGDGGHEGLQYRIRAHANFAEFVPLTLLLAFMLELQEANVQMLHGICSALLAGRVLHAICMLNKGKPQVVRVIGMLLTIGAILTAAIGLLNVSPGSLH